MLVTNFSIDDVVSEIKTLYCKTQHQALASSRLLLWSPSRPFLSQQQPALFASQHLSIHLFLLPFPTPASSFSFSNRSILLFSSRRRSLSSVRYQNCTKTIVPHQCALSYGPVLRGCTRSNVESLVLLFLIILFYFPYFLPPSTTEIL